MEKNNSNENKRVSWKIDYENLEVITDPKKIDIYNHLKLSMKNSKRNCQCDLLKEKQPKYYCIPCKVSCCSRCSLSMHQKHLLVLKSNYIINESNINKMLKPLEDEVKNNSLMSNCLTEKNKFLKMIEDSYDKMLEYLNKWKEFKEKEIKSLFENFDKNINNLMSKKDNIKKEIMEFMEKNQKFFNIDIQKEGYNKDEDNTLFLISFDLLNMLNEWSVSLKKITQFINSNFEEYEVNEKNKNEIITKKVSCLLAECNNNKINLNTKNDKLLDDEIDEKYLPYYKTNIEIEKFNADSLVEIDKRIYRYGKIIEALKSTVYKSFVNHGNYSDINKENNVKLKGGDNLFSQRKIKSNKIMENNFLVPKKAIKNENDITLDNPLINRYFSNLISDLYEKYFKMLTKELQSSHADLKIKPSEDNENDTARVIEGTNQIFIFDKKSSKMIKKTIKLTKNPFGYTKFPYGCRGILLGDKFYITGGKSEMEEYKNVIIYDRKTDTIKRIIDLNHPRSYHSVVYNNTFETLMVIGGEYCNTVEIFDPVSNRWQDLPPLNIPRCNPLFFFDEPRGNMYVLFGMEGNYIDSNYTDSIEVLDLTKIKQGWSKVNYSNKANMALKCYLNIYKLNDELFLIFGGFEGREIRRNVCLYNTVKNEITKIGRELMDRLRKEAKNSRKLSSIITTISRESIA